MSERGQTWRQTGPGEKVEIPNDYDDLTFANGSLVVGRTVIAGDRHGLYLVDVPFADLVYSVDPESDYHGGGYLSCTRYPAELLDAGLAIVEGKKT